MDVSIPFGSTRSGYGPYRDVPSGPLTYESVLETPFQPVGAASTMLRGLDARGTTADYEPSIVNVADRTEPSGRVTVYVDEDPSPVTRRRLRHVGERLAFFADAGVVPAPTVVRWPTDVHVSEPAGGEETVAGYEEFREAVGSSALDPFFERDGGDLSVPDLCLAVRRDGRLVGLYPRVKDGHVQTVDECLAALAAGNDVENVAD